MGQAPALDSHIYSFAVFSFDMPCGAYIARWLDEARAYGDIVIPEPRLGYFIIFHAGSPTASIERAINDYYGRRNGWPPEEVAKVIDAFRALPQ